ncbi:MAG: response regulator [Myxococcales bacterium]
MRVLVAEDEPLLARAIERALAKEGYEVVLASNGKEALDALRAHPCGVLLVDVSMPEMNGLTLVGELRDDARFAHVRVVLMTGVREMDARATGLPVLAKPFRNQELLDAIAAAVATH